ncbi:DUF2254 domain-containing protein [Corallococcus sp. BB11-1]|uniref:DUF2254 domain-containing protein n=1 Tax=Corallococcus sp. BB11-1 TaxID=2996783 RepID=UPI00226ED766|nr:DUF2254 domain-containing protein [Corallococcus sp. BB11-1]MCY1037177.1 DUF2254 domain-containing protein [Corallococcus sp. BB11-1]
MATLGEGTQPWRERQMAGIGALPGEQARSGGAPKRARRGHETHRLRDWFVRSTWLLPMLAAVLGVVLGVMLADPAPDSVWALGGLAWRGTPRETRGVLSSVLGTAITSLSIILSLSMLVAQNLGAQYSPRLLRVYQRDAGIRVVLPVFIATCVYCVVAMQRLGLVAGTQEQPRPAAGMAVLLLVACGAALVFQVLHTLQLMRVENLVRMVAGITLRVARGLDGRRQLDAPPVTPQPPSTQALPLRAPSDGFVVDVDGVALLARAEARGLVVHVDVAIGEPVRQGAPIGRVEPEGPDRPRVPAECGDFVSAISLDRWRDQDADVSLGLRQLVDIAIKALSPAVNDPYTAVESLDQLTFVLCGLARLRQGPRVLANGEGRARVFLRAPELRDHLELATDQITRYGAGEPLVLLRLLRLVGEVGQCARQPADRQAARATLHRILAEAERAGAAPSQLELQRRYARDVERALDGVALPPLQAIEF